MKKIRLRPKVQASFEPSNRSPRSTFSKLWTITPNPAWAAVKALHGAVGSLLRLRLGNHRVFFDEPEDTIAIHP